MDFRRIFILTGAGISAESGIATFRGGNGLWDGEDPAIVATPEGFEANRARVLAFYDEQRRKVRAAEPNAAHKAIAKLQQDPRFEVTLVTQNIDDLHERAGSRSVMHMHGGLDQNSCTACGALSIALETTSPDAPCPECGEAALRPRIVWFGEMPFHLEEIDDALCACDLFISIGSSGQVAPAKTFVKRARKKKARTLCLTKDWPANKWKFHEIEFGCATATVPAAVQKLLEGQLEIHSPSDRKDAS